MICSGNGLVQSEQKPSRAKHLGSIYDTFYSLTLFTQCSIENDNISNNVSIVSFISKVDKNKLILVN